MPNLFKTEADWNKFIKTLTKPKKPLTSKKEIIPQLYYLSEKVILEQYNKSKKPLGVLFSGGIDSTFIAWILKKNNCDFICFSVGTKRSKDLEWAERISQELNFKLVKKVYSLEEFETTLKKVAPLFKTELKNEEIAGYVKLSVGCVVYAGLELAKTFNISDIYTGLGSEEIFAGYHKHKKKFLGTLASKDLNKECWDELKLVYNKDIKRDTKIANLFKITLLCPYLSKELIEYAYSIPLKFKISKTERKIILRECALKSELPEEFAFRKKIAAQYGSYFDKTIKKLARQNKFKYKSDYLQKIIN